MKIVIDINEETYTRLKNALIINAGNTFYNEILTSVAEGTPLPKGHGDLIDRDELKIQMPTPIEDEYKTAYRIIDNAPVIILADNEVD